MQLVLTLPTHDLCTFPNSGQSASLFSETNVLVVKAQVLLDNMVMRVLVFPKAAPSSKRLEASDQDIAGV